MRRGLLAMAVLSGALVAGLPSAVPHPAAAQRQDEVTGARPSDETCERLRPARWRPTSGAADRRGTLRLFAIQYKPAIEHVRSYRSFRTAMRCLMEDFVVPHLVPGLPALVSSPRTSA
jgi:hypothetical protein